ncbi:hypothetical protein DNTS_004206 [Danionella cerebrum]|nr:hypothetical protein DNTS_004206 [Danionella translucida]
MPFLHGFRRIVYEQEDGESVSGALADLLDRESQSPVFTEGISYSLFRVAHLGLVSAAEVLLRYGADLNFEDPVSYYNPLHIAVLRNKPDMVRMLISQGADIEKRDRTALLHALASSDGLTVDNVDNIQLLLERGADVNACSQDGETPMSSLTFLVKEALDSSVRGAKKIGHFCIRVAHLLLRHGGDANQGELWEQSLIYTSLENFDLLFPLTALLLQHRACFLCSQSTTYWTGQELIFTRLAQVLQEASHAQETADVLNKAEVLLDLALIYSPVFPPLFPRSQLELVSTNRPLLELYGKLEEQERSPLSLKCLCKRLIIQCLKPWPFEEKLRALPLPDRLKDLLLPEKSWRSRAGWDRVVPRRSAH